MATNLVSLVMQFLTPDMIGRIGTALELDRNKAQPPCQRYWRHSTTPPLNRVARKSSPTRQATSRLASKLCKSACHRRRAILAL